MHGPDIVARTISKATVRGTKSTKAWQYHGRSDAHSKVACWAVLFDLLHSCDVFANQAAQGKVSFAVNHEMVGTINKKLDLVICAVPRNRKPGGRRSFEELGRKCGIQLSPSEEAILKTLPVIEEERASDVSEVLIALEAKACFTDLIGSMPRLHAEILATGYLAKLAAPTCITASFTLVNFAKSFVSPGKQGSPKKHNQPHDAETVLSMIRKAIPTVQNQPTFGYDAIGASLIECQNDGSPVKIINSAPAPTSTDFINYGRMIASLCGAYRKQFGNR